MVLLALINHVSLVTFAGYLVHALKNNYCEVGSDTRSCKIVCTSPCVGGAVYRKYFYSFIALLVPICSFGIMPGSVTPFFKICISVDRQAFGLFMHMQ